MTPEIMEILNKMKGAAEGTAIQRFIEEKVQEMNDLSSVKGTLEEKGRVIEARQESVKILDSLFGFLSNKPLKKKRTNYR